jgi:REP element-mobilizing transposase RayT
VPHTPGFPVKCSWGKLLHATFLDESRIHGTGWRCVQLYCEMLAEQLRKFSVEVWAYCLMPNHLHLILTPQGADGMSRALGEAHRRYTNFINARGRWTGHLFQSRFASNSGYTRMAQ